MDVGSLHTLQFLKNPDTLHWRLDTVYLGRDEHGLWLASPVGTVAQKGMQEPKAIRNRGVHLIPTSDWWVFSLHAGAESATHFLDISTPATFAEDRVTMIDLDLDVVRFADGRVILEDEDEFTEHQVTLGYPSEWIEAALAAAEWGMAAVTSDTEPLGDVARRWWETAADL
ncbi:MAG: DUF402 domain-containing protein [Acidimicrobiia bacterium]|nr:DUF402 domain-containing protein [Acidimicrobiia bacterium]NNC74662.1 DUF402 domain-containing protein [Acidimicrobiia bacterium]